MKDLIFLNIHCFCGHHRLFSANARNLKGDHLPSRSSSTGIAFFYSCCFCTAIHSVQFKQGWLRLITFSIAAKKILVEPLIKRSDMVLLWSLVYIFLAARKECQICTTDKYFLSMFGTRHYAFILSKSLELV